MKVQIGYGPTVYGTVEAVDSDLQYTGQADTLRHLLASMPQSKRMDAQAFLASLPKRLTGRIWAKVLNDEEEEDT